MEFLSPEVHSPELKALKKSMVDGVPAMLLAELESKEKPWTQIAAIRWNAMKLAAYTGLVSPKDHVVPHGDFCRSPMETGNTAHYGAS